MNPIEFEAKTDRELLLLTAQATNNISEHLGKMNDKLGNHEERIDTLEKQEPPVTTKKGTALGVGVATVVSAIITTIFNKFGIGQ